MSARVASRKSLKAVLASADKSHKCYFVIVLDFCFFQTLTGQNQFVVHQDLNIHAQALAVREKSIFHLFAVVLTQPIYQIRNCAAFRVDIHIGTDDFSKPGDTDYLEIYLQLYISRSE